MTKKMRQLLQRRERCGNLKGTRTESPEALQYVASRKITAGDEIWLRGLSEARPSHHLELGMMGKDYWAPERVK